MNTDEIHETTQAFESLRQFARRPRRSVEVCEMCSLELRPEHAHLVELTQRRLHCACDACAMLFSNRSDAKYKRVPRDVRLLTNFKMSDADWDALLIPINLAFFFQNSLDSRVSALYPSPAGATESLLPLEAWANIVQNNPALNSMEADVEALLVNRVGASRELSEAEHYIVPIDACYASGIDPNALARALRRDRGLEGNWRVLHGSAIESPSNDGQDLCLTWRSESKARRLPNWRPLRRSLSSCA